MLFVHNTCQSQCKSDYNRTVYYYWSLTHFVLLFFFDHIKKRYGKERCIRNLCLLHIHDYVAMLAYICIEINRFLTYFQQYTGLIELVNCYALVFQIWRNEILTNIYSFCDIIYQMTPVRPNPQPLLHNFDFHIHRFSAMDPRNLSNPLEDCGYESERNGPPKFQNPKRTSAA